MNDSLWSFGFNFGFQQSKRVDLGIDITEERITGGARVGRSLFEKVRGSVGLYLKSVEQTADEFLNDRFKLDGVTTTLSLSLSRKVVNNYIDPTDGTSVALSQQFVVGDYSYLETLANANYYYPVSYTDTYLTHFKFSLQLGKLSPYQDEEIPIIERYKLGGPNNLRAYYSSSIGPTFPLLKTPFGQSVGWRKGGDRKLLFQAEYFMPLIPQAGIKALLFFDAGRVYDNEESFEVADLTKDLGFGIRWMTPIAPFRFEWAFPVDDDGNIGNHKAGDKHWIHPLAFLLAAFI